MIRLRGMTWKHERGINPLVAASAEFTVPRPDVSIEWDARSLSDFELYPLEQLADRYDLIMIDHPHIGAAVAQNLLLSLNERLPDTYLREQEASSVGKSHASYIWNDSLWALAADAAAQVSAFRGDLLQAAESEVPITWDDVSRLARRLPEGRRLGLALVPVHAFSCFFTLTAQIGGEAYWSQAKDVPDSVGDQALGILQELLPLLHPVSINCDPIAMSELMATTDEIVYVPLMYGYSNYARDGFRPYILNYTNIPSDHGGPSGSMIGGVGIAISARCQHPEIAADFIKMIMSGEYQRSSFFKNGGQPGHRSAWTDPEVNRHSNDFFANTLRTLDLGSMRPRYDGYIPFQEQAGTAIRNFLMNGGDHRRDFIRQLNALFMASRKGKDQ